MERKHHCHGRRFADFLMDSAHGFAVAIFDCRKGNWQQHPDPQKCSIRRISKRLASRASGPRNLWKSNGNQCNSYGNLMEAPMEIWWKSYENLMEILWKSMEILRKSYILQNNITEKNSCLASSIYKRLQKSKHCMVWKSSKDALLNTGCK